MASSDILPHIFFPRRLPGSLSKVQLISMEDNLLDEFAGFLHQLDPADFYYFDHDGLKAKNFQHIQNMFATWNFIQEKQETETGVTSFAKCVSELNLNGSLAFYAREQNATFLITREDTSRCRFLSFIASQSNSTVFASDGDLVAEFPANCIDIPFSDLVKSKEFARKVLESSTEIYSPAMKEGHKSGHTFDEDRDVAHPMLVTQYFTTTLSDHNSANIGNGKFHRISKKIRDQVLFDHKNQLPFRRSGLWFSIKVVLQLELVNRFGGVGGTLLYKLIMLKFMEYCCETWCISVACPVSADESHQMIAKIARRLAKVSELVEHSTSTSGVDGVPYFLKIRAEVEGTVALIREQLEQKWTTIIEQERVVVAPLEVNNSEPATIHQLTQYEAYTCDDDLDSSLASVSSRRVPSPPARTRFRSNCASGMFPKDYLQRSSLGEEVHGLVLYDLEKYILTLGSSILSASNCKYYLELFEAYISRAKPYYANDPVGASRMILASMKMVQLFDSLAVKRCPLLEHHDSGINETILDVLLAPMQTDVFTLEQIEHYFVQRNHGAKFPSLIEEGQLTSNSFSVRFAQQDPEMIKLQSTILEVGEGKRQEKMDEVECVRARCEELRRQAMGMEHEYALEYAIYTGNLRIGNQCSTECVKCELEKQANQCKVALYEKPLPESPIIQLGVVFELLIPVEIAVLRDALFVFSREFCTEDGCMTKTTTAKHMWTSVEQVKEYYDYGHRHQRHVELGSTSTFTLKNHLGKHSSHCHVEDKASKEDFIVSNGLNGYLSTASSGRILSYSKAGAPVFVKRSCTLKVQPGSPYAGLQWALESTDHTQNEVLARQIECPQNLPLAEYKEFGYLRAGHRLQYRNIFKALILGSLSFHEESVVNLILQAIWQAGPGVPFESQHYREAHEELNTDFNFIGELLAALNELLRKNTDNWKDHYVLLIVVTLCTRVLSMCSGNEEILEKVIKLLRDCRAVASAWISAVECLLKKTTGDHIDMQKNLRLKLVQIASFGALTFSVGDYHSLGEIAGSASDLALWLDYITIIDENILLTNSDLHRLPTLTRNLLRSVRCIGADLENHFHSNVSRMQCALTYFVKGHWTDLAEQEDIEWQRCAGDKDQWCSLECTDKDGDERLIQLDIVLGCFLVDGSPIGLLPHYMTHDTHFQRMFGNLVFTVHNYGDQVHITKDNYSGCTYRFQMSGYCNERVIVTEVNRVNEEWELIPHHAFHEDIPKLLVDNFSHWKFKSKNVVEFRSLNFADADFRTNIKFTLDLDSKVLKEMEHGKLLIDIRSEMYKGVVEIMTRLEGQEFIHLFTSPAGEEGSVLTIELPRMGLHFNVDSSGNIKSKEYRGFQVAANQGLGTLIGLSCGLLITCPYSNPIFLVPHAEPKIGPPTNGHHIVTIDSTHLRSPTYFAIEVDEILRRLKPQPVQSAWLYLVHLHALTSGVLPEPFTGVTGTESAITLLQSSICWSCEPMDKESLATLKGVESLSPARNYYLTSTAGMEQVTFPAHIPSMCAHDAYKFMVQKLIYDIERMAFAFGADVQPQKTNSPRKEADGLKLAKRAYWRSSPSYSPQAQIKPEFEAQFSSGPSLSKIVSSLDLDSRDMRTELESTNLKAVRLIANLGKTWSSPTKILPQLLTKAICNAKSVCHSSIQLAAVEFRLSLFETTPTSFVSKWLQLYNYARVVVKKGLHSEWTMMLTAMAFTLRDQFESQDELTEHLKILHIIAVNHKHFMDLDPPTHPGYQSTNEYSFEATSLIELIRTHAIQFSAPKRYGESKSQHKRRKTAERLVFDQELNRQAGIISNYLQSNQRWLEHAKLQQAFDIHSFGLGTFSHLKSSVNAALKSTLQRWYQNKELKEFVDKVENWLKQLLIVAAPHQPPPALTRLATEIDTGKLNAFAGRPQFDSNQFWILKVRKEDTKIGMCVIDIDELDLVKPSSGQSCTGEFVRESDEYPLQHDINGSMKMDEIFEEYSGVLTESWNKYMKYRTEVLARRTLDACALELDFDKALKLKNGIDKINSDMWTFLLAQFQLNDANPDGKPCPEVRTLRNAGILFRPTPTTILPYLVRSDTLPSTTHEQIEIMAICWMRAQLVRRCLRYASGGPSLQMALCRELASCTRPRRLVRFPARERPEWLLLQLELDLIIRQVQVDVAEKMGQENDGHSLMQLNMGEGKTTVIIPMLVSRSATGSHLCRVTVLKSLFNTNKKMLAFAIGGLLNQRVYTFPCRRDMDLTSENIRTMRAIYEECVARRGVVMTVPEFRLSFQLKGYERCLSSGDEETALGLIQLGDWLRDHARDILDECDEILNVKYQLVYTIGRQEEVSGGQNRWIICQKLLKLLPGHLEDIYKHSTDYNSGVELR